MANKVDPVPNVNQCPASKLCVHIQGKPDHMTVGTQNTIVFFRATQKDDDTNNNNVQSDVKSEIVILSEKNEVKCKYKNNPGESTFITIGNNCDIVEIDINPELEKKLKDTGEFEVTKGDKLVSVRWKNGDDWSQDEKAYSEWKIRFIKDGKKLDTKQLEKEIFERIVDENNNGLRNLVTELITVHKAKLQHIESGCIQLVLSTQSPEDAQRLEKHKDELKALLHRTIIPESIEIDLELQHTKSPEDQESLDKENAEADENQKLRDSQVSLEDIKTSDTEVDEVDVKEEIEKPQRANRVLSTFFKIEGDPPTSSTADSNLKETERCSVKRTVGTKPKDQQMKEVNLKIEALAERDPSRSRQLMSSVSEPYESQESDEKRQPMTAPIGFEGVHGLPKFDIINEENVGSSNVPELTDFEEDPKSSAGASSLAGSTSPSTSRNLPTLHSAIKNNEDIQNVSALLETTADVNEKDNAGNTALHLAVQCNNTSVVRLLLESNADVECTNSNSDHPLHLACVANKLDIVALLLENNASTHSRNVDGDTPLHLAMRFGFMETIELLISKLRYPNTKNNMGDSSLHFAARYGISEAVTKLVQAGASTDLQNNNLETPLIVAVKSSKLAVARALIDNNADVNCVDQNGDSPLHIATSRLIDDIAHLLLNQSGIDVNIQNNERYTPAYLARGEIRHRLTTAGSSTRKGWGCLVM